jgi:hypothetical protein
MKRLLLSCCAVAWLYVLYAAPGLVAHWLYGRGCALLAAPVAAATALAGIILTVVIVVRAGERRLAIRGRE